MTPKYLWDTSSLIDCCRWHQSLDESGQRRLYEFLRAGFAPVRGNFAIVAGVWAELGRGSDTGEWIDVLGMLGFLEHAILPDSGDLDQSDLRKIDREFFVSPGSHSREGRRKLRGRYLEEADPYIVLAALRLQQGAACIVVSEETLRPDGKKFKKIPVLCRELGIECIDFRECLRRCGFALD